MTPGKAIYIMLVATALALAIVWQRTWQRDTGYRIDRLSREIAEQEEARKTLLSHVSKLENPQRIMDIVDRYGLRLRGAPAEAPGGQPARDDTDSDEGRAVTPPAPAGSFRTP